MPANLTPEYLSAEQRYRQAASPQERLEALEEMLRTVPKHKGTEKLQADIKRKIARLRQEMQTRRGGARAQPFFHIPREGAGQVVLVGPPNSGKSSLLAALTNAAPEVAPYPLTTRVPQPGMMHFENVQVQLVDTPPVCREFSEGWLYGLIRGADAAVLVLDCSDDGILYLEDSLRLLPDNRVFLVGQEAVVPDDASLPRGAYKRTVVVANKWDLPGARENLAVLVELLGERLPGEPLPVSAVRGDGLEQLRSRIFSALHKIRVYSKPPGQKPDLQAPFVLPRGSTVRDAAEVIHKELAERLKYARLWGRGYHGQMVGRDHVLEDGDILELHA
ncbi:MAG: TGS domain-containing protein [Armatimonadota bacterium]|nr:TGS domain-containing protein [Armatimonadota bacterium]MDR5675984.1 TGS domain-containing protein [Armatimonadota bacterium]MDR7386321.1 TGS domain-containing protein [Armatimonadota bacterium]MDR7388660.1 TGS domain-containing protein [Armatimonadota bacterium]MDR7393323.1 TGS domain-containing protein [Armatimonadota bacterium]